MHRSSHRIRRTAVSRTSCWRPTSRPLMPSSTAKERAPRAVVLVGQSHRLASGLSQSFGAFQAEQLVGTVALEYSAKPKTQHSALVIGMYVKPAARRLGAGAMLMQSGHRRRARTASLRILGLTVTRAMRLPSACTVRRVLPLGESQWPSSRPPAQGQSPQNAVGWHRNCGLTLRSWGDGHRQTAWPRAGQCHHPSRGPRLSRRPPLSSNVRPHKPPPSHRHHMDTAKFDYFVARSTGLPIPIKSWSRYRADSCRGGSGGGFDK